MCDAYGYIRVSSEGQSADGKDGFPRQREAVEKYAAAHDIHIVQYFEETFTGKVEDRPALNEMIDALNGGNVRTVLIERLDRLGRKLTVQEGIIARLQHHNYVLISTLEPDLVPLDDDSMESAMRIAMRQMLGIFSELERKSIVHKLRGARQRAKAKDPTRREGQKNFGFRDGEQETIARIMELRRTRISVREICERINTEGRATRKGRPWHANQVVRILARAAARS